MSKTIDEKVVQMKFDNSNFERNVAKSLQTLDNLKWKITETDLESSKGLSNLNKAAKDIDMSGLSKGIETVQARFSALQVIGVTALANLTNSAINAGKRIASSLGNALITGGKNRALNIQNAKFQIEGLLGTDEFQKQWARIDESINWAVKDTAYGYDSAAKAASQFMASNVKVGKEMDTSLRAISGVAAMTNSAYDDIANVFTRVAGQGRVMAIDLNSLAARGMNAAAVLAKHFGKTEAEIRDMVSKGKVSFNEFALAMDNAFGEHAKKGNETFEGALANMKAAMSRIGAKVWDPLLTNQRDVFNQMRLLINDLNNNYLDGPIKGLNNKLTSVFQNIVKFFELGGMKNVLLGIGDILGYIGSVLKPIKEGFREIFPKKSIEELVSYTERFKEWTSQLKLSEETARKLKDTFKGLFSVIRIGVDFVLALASGIGKLLSALTGVPGGILGVTQAIGNWVTKLSSVIHESKIFTNVIEGVSNALTTFGNKMKEFFSKLDIFGGLVKGFKAVFDMISQLGSELGLFISTLFKSGNLELAFKAVNSVFQGGLLVALIRFINQMKMLTMRSKQFVGNISGTLYQLKETLSALQYSIKASAIMEIAKAMLVLAGALLLLSVIDPVKLGGALTATALGMGELIGALYALGKFNMNILDAAKIWALTQMIRSLTNTLLILSIGLSILSDISWQQMLVSVGGMSAVLWELVGALYIIPTDKDVYRATKAMRKMGTALLVISVALKILSGISWQQMLVAVGGMSAVLWELVLAVNMLPKMDLGQRVAGLTGTAFAMIILSVALKKLATMNWNDIWRSVSAMGIALAELTAALLLLGNFGGKSFKGGMSLIAASLAMISLGSALKKLGELNWEQIKKSLIAMGAALAELTAAMVIAGNFKGFTGSMAINGLIGSLIPLALALKLIGSMNIGQLVASLIAIASAFVILGVAGMLLGKVGHGLLIVAGAIALFGVGALAIGGGLMLMAAGISALAVALAGGATLIVAGLTSIIIGIINLIPSIIKTIGDGIVIICDALLAAAPKIATTILTIVVEILKALANDGPLIVKYLAEFLINVLNELATYLPAFIEAAFNVVKAFITGLGNALKGLDPILSLEGILGLVGLTGLMYMLSGLGSLIGPASIGVLALGALIAELAVVLAAIGGLAQIPGLKWLVEEGGNFMQSIGTAIGQLIGGIAGGIAKGISSSMPEIATNLSKFMENIKPFLDGCRIIDKSVLAGVTILAAAILEITAANLCANIAKFLTFGSSFAELGTDLSDFMNNSKDFIKNSQDLKPESMKGFSILADTIVKITAAGFLDSITKWLSGSSSLRTFGTELVIFGKGLKEFANSVEGLNTGAIIESAKAADGLVELSNKVPKRDGLAQWFGGKKSLQIFGGELNAFGKGLKEFSDSIMGLNVENINKATGAADKLIDLSNKVPNREGIGQWFTGKKSLKIFGGELEAFADGLLTFSNKVAGLNIRYMTYATQAADVLIDLSNKVPNRAGMAQWFTGKKSLEIFGGELEAFGDGLISFSDKVKDLRPNTMNSAVEAADKLIDLSNKVPNRAGMAQWFTGKQSLKIFGGELEAFGDGLKDFGESMDGVNVENLAKSADAAQKLAELSNIVPNREGMAQWFTGKQSLKIFGGELDALGEGLSSFCDRVKDVKMENLTNVVAAVKTLAEATNQLPEIKGKDLENRAWGFGTGIDHIANGLSSFCNKMNGCNFSIDVVNNAVSAVKTLSETFNNLPNKDGGKIENRGWGLGAAIDHYANGLSSFINKLNGQNMDPNYISSVANSIKTMAEAVNILPNKDGGKIENRAWGLGAAMTHFGNGFGYLLSKLTESNFDENKINSAANSIKTMAEAVNVLPNKDGGKIENRAWGLGAAITHFGNGLGNLNNNLNGSNFDPDKVRSAADSVKLFGEAVNNLPDKDGGKIENRAWGLGAAITHFGNGLNSLSNNLNSSNFDPDKVRSSADSVKLFGEAVNNLPDKDGGKIENRAWGLGCAISHFGNGLNSLSNNLNGSNFDPDKVKSAAEVVRTFGEIFNSLPDKDGGTIENRAWGLGESIKHFGNGLNSFAVSISETSFDNIPTAIGYIKEFASITPDIPDNAGAKLSGFATGISDLAPKFAGFISNVSNIDFTNADASFENIKKLLSSLESISGFNIDNINTVGTAIKTISDSLNNLANIPEDVANNFNNALKTLGENGFKSFLDTFKDINTNMNAKGLDAITGFTSGITKNQSLATTALENLHNACKERINIDEYEIIGKQIVEGFAQGISNNQDLATTAMTILTSKVEAQARQDLDINSPSKVFKKIGSGIPEGFAQGILMFKDSIKSSVNNMSNSAINSTRNVISKISDIINGDIDTQPTIRPVIDLDGVTSGIGTLNTMLNRSSLAVEANVGAISSNFRGKIQNGNVEVVSAIDKLRKDLGNVKGDTYVIDGITYDNGSEIQEAVGTLVRAAKIERRT